MSLLAALYISAGIRSGHRITILLFVAIMADWPGATRPIRTGIGHRRSVNRGCGRVAAIIFSGILSLAALTDGFITISTTAAHGWIALTPTARAGAIGCHVWLARDIAANGQNLFLPQKKLLRGYTQTDGIVSK